MQPKPKIEATTSRLDLVQLRDVLAELTSRQNPDPMLGITLDLLQQCKQRIEEQSYELALLRKHIFGRRGERIASDSRCLFADMLEAATSTEASSSTAAQNAESPGSDDSKSKSKPRKRRPLCPTNHVSLDVPAQERPCPECGGERHTIGREVSFVIEHTPARVEVIRYDREKIACEPCGGELARADTPKERVVDRAAPGPGMLSALAIYKHVDGLPLQRIRKILTRSGADLAVQTLNRWEEFGRTLSMPVIRAIRGQVLDADAIVLDDTGLRVRDPSAEHGIRRGHIWVFVALKFDPGGDLSKTEEWVYYIYAPTWHARYPEEFLRDFRGPLQGDGYRGYDVIAGTEKGEAKNLVAGCSMHARRPFVRALELRDSLAGLFVDGFKALFAVEARAKKDNLRAADRLALRKQESLPIWERMHTRANQLRSLPLSKPMREGVSYLENQWPKLRVPFEIDGRLEIDTGAAERRLRRVATGRRAWLFAGSQKGAERIADMLSLVSTAEAAGIDPGRYLKDIYCRIADGWPQGRLPELLPHQWVETQQSPE